MIVIVGAGLAGLSAAQRLVQSGYTDFIILEAKDRCGGRVQSIYDTDGTRLDLGAQWLHGEHDNPLYKWLEIIGLIEGPESEEIEFEGIFRTQLSQQPLQENVHKVLSLLIETKATLYESSKYLSPNCRPVEIFRRTVEDAIKQDPSLQCIDPKLIEATIRWFELHEAIDNSCEQLSFLSMRAYSYWTDFNDGKMVRLKGGWQSVVSKLSKCIPRDKISLECPVKKLTRSGRKLTVHYGYNNSTIDCDHVLVTVSIGVLKERMNELFEPKLSAQLSQHIRCIGFDVVDKILIQFARPFLQQERGLKCLWIKTNNGEDDCDLPDWAKCITGFEPVSNSSHHLLAWIGGAGATKMEQECIDKIEQVCLKLLQKFLPADTTIPNIESIHCTRWGTDPFIKGSYSYESINSIELGNLRDNPWAPLYSDDNSPQILFAGEATAKDMYATAHGAIISGWREADRLLSFYSDTKSNLRS